MANDLLPFKPTVATTCFGMNDGGYSPMDPGKAQRYRDGQKSIVAQLKKAGVRLIVVGSPGCVDADTFAGHSPERAAMYNKTLAQLRDIARNVAQEEGVVFADVFDPMMAAMTKAKAKYGRQYHLAGGDGVHPGPQRPPGHGLRLPQGPGLRRQHRHDHRRSGRATRPRPAKGTRCSPAPAARSRSRAASYPFCFYGDPAQPSSTRGVIEFIPFNEELNRFRLVVRGLAQAKAKVTWGAASKQFAAAAWPRGSTWPRSSRQPLLRAVSQGGRAESDGNKKWRWDWSRT